MSICNEVQITKSFLESLKKPEDEPAPQVTTDELAKDCSEGFPWWAEPLGIFRRIK